MSLDKTAKAIGDYKTIYLSIAILLGGATWLANQVFATDEELAQAKAGIIQEVNSDRIDSIRSEIDILIVERQFAETEKDRRKITAQIEIKENLIKKIEGK